ncbi:peptidase M23 family protein [Gordonia polyisoprenivorans NBRC 16320 = JCM 10675]|uniref:M23 family metallopeptidase n=1 Tax=Gordonia polyisoprenivorans TaxID=84595 RepID=A0A846WP99_9ACTN|nr:M23 family metallopeptidase [Gordonia polyisoprenivorans]NKY03249.1 M23 family metallopeptidase [Gordonia polyisoprenivorans]GAB21736.1 peptidase M23 family protein [Gordonia polyisoprenivorans NBRC 16320 = JCM 10675]
MDDLAERGFPGGSVSGTAVVGGRRRRDERINDLTAEEMTTIIPVDRSDIYYSDETTYGDTADFEWDVDDWAPIEDGSASVGRRRSTRRTTTSEITQDILIPEGEFDEYRHDEPFDVLGATVDEYAGNEYTVDEYETDERVGTVTAEPTFRRVPAGATRRSRGKHRIAAPPTALRSGRVALVAVAAGAALAAAAVQINSDDDAGSATPVPTADVGGAAAADTGPGIAPASANTPDTSMYGQQLQVGKQLADAEAARINAMLPPEFVSPVPLGQYQLTSLYAMRWGVMHAGLDFAAPLGTPIHAATDGVVLEAGPASGFGNWIQVKAPDGTVTVYGHMYSNGVLVHKGETVKAGQVIGLVGSDGQSTGPHCHFEVWLNGKTKIDPAPWLAEHGVRLSNYVG